MAATEAVERAVMVVEWAEVVRVAVAVVVKVAAVAFWERLLAQWAETMAVGEMVVEALQVVGVAPGAAAGVYGHSGQAHRSVSKHHR